jgi:hypothetical protein
MHERLDRSAATEAGRSLIAIDTSPKKRHCPQCHEALIEPHFWGRFRMTRLWRAFRWCGRCRWAQRTRRQRLALIRPPEPALLPALSFQQRGGAGVGAAPGPAHAAGARGRLPPGWPATLPDVPQHGVLRGHADPESTASPGLLHPGVGVLGWGPPCRRALAERVAGGRPIPDLDDGTGRAPCGGSRPTRPSNWSRDGADGAQSAPNPEETQYADRADERRDARGVR